MLFAKVTFAVGLTLFGAAASGLTGTWALAVSTISMLAAGLVAVIVMEERDYTAVEGLYPAGSSLEPATAEPAPGESVAQAA